MTDYEKWLVMARASFETAELAKNNGDLRSAASRYYYAAYQAATSLIVYRGLTPPEEREAWSHDDTRDIIVNDLPPLIESKDDRKDLRVRLVGLYELRIKADYQASLAVNNTDMDKARRDAGFILHRAAVIVVKGRPQ